MSNCGIRDAVTVDAEDYTTTDSTLSIVRDLRTEFSWLGTVLQAYLKRTEDDCREFAASGARIRLCKGAYDEPASVAYRAGDDVIDSYLRCLQVLMAGSGYPMVASHDPQIIAAVPAMARENGRGVDDFEYILPSGACGAAPLTTWGRTSVTHQSLRKHLAATHRWLTCVSDLCEPPAKLSQR